MNRFVFYIVFFLFAPVFLPAQDLYSLDHITRIELTFAEDDWEFPLHYLHSLGKNDRHLGHATINGERFDSVGVRFKGFSSYRRTFKKNPLNIKLDYIHKKADYQKIETLKLANGNLEPSWMREVLAYQIARKYMVAPRSNFAQVFVNGKYYGLFGNTESVNGKFARRNLYADKDNVIVKGNAPAGPFSGRPSSLQFLGNDSMAYAAGYELKSDYGWQALMELTRVLEQEPERIESILDMDRAIWMLAFNNVLVNLDSYSDFLQNYYLVQDDNGRFNFVLWDVNLAFDGLGKPNGVTMQHDYNPLAKKDNLKYPLINLVLNSPTYQKIYFAHCRTILNENFKSGWYKKEGERLRTLIADAVRQDSNWLFEYEAFERNFTETFVRQEPSPFPYPGITELMDARIRFLENHPEYKKIPPEISEVNARLSADSSEAIILATIKNVKKAFVAYRKKSSHIFQKIRLFDDGQHGDGLAGDGIFGAKFPAKGKKVQYYIFAENDEAAMLSPERAEHEFHVFRWGE